MKTPKLNIRNSMTIEKLFEKADKSNTILMQVKDKVSKCLWQNGFFIVWNKELNTLFCPAEIDDCLTEEEYKTFENYIKENY